MRKYLALARAALLDALQEKSEIFIWVLLEALPVFVMGSLWLSNRQHLIGITLPQIISYYIIAMLVSRLTEFYFDEDMSDLVRTGEFSKYLLKPIRFPFAFIPQAFGRKIISGLVMIITMLIPLVLIFRNYLSLPNLSILPFFLTSLILTIGIRYTFSALAGAGAFFWERSEALTHARWVMEMIAGGYLLPLSLYPSWIRIIPESLPFKYVYYVPVGIFTGILDPKTAMISILTGSAWLIFLLLLSHWVWNKGVVRYSGVGG